MVQAPDTSSVFLRFCQNHGFSGELIEDGATRDCIEEHSAQHLGVPALHFLDFRSDWSGQTNP
jgi:hypothetical protein